MLRLTLLCLLCALPRAGCAPASALLSAPAPSPASSGEPADADADVLPVEQLDSLLHWAITNADGAELHRLAEAASGGSASSMTLSELKEKQAHVKEAMDYLKSLPTEAELVRLAVQQLLGSTANQTAGESTAEGALDVLLDLAASADVANDLHSLGALQPILEQLASSSARARALAAHTLGTGAANNPPFSAQVASLGGVPLLLGRLASDEDEVRVKALFALAQLVRADGPSREAFMAGGGPGLLLQAMEGEHEPISLRKKALVLLTDLSKGGDGENVTAAAVERLAKALVSMLRQAARSSDLDGAEKALAGWLQLLPDGAALRAAGGAEALRELRAAVAAASAGEAEEDSFVGDLLALLGQAEAATGGRHEEL